MASVRVLMVEDSATIRGRLEEILSADPEIELVGVAGDGKTAIELCRTLKPNVVTMDMMLPMMSGLAATEYIMAHCPTPILIVSSSVNRGELFKTYEALAAGAVDVLEKPLGDETDAAWERRFVATVKLVSRIRVITHPRARLSGVSAPRASTPAPSFAVARGQGYEVVAVGASTGGPGAIIRMLNALPPSFPLPILLVLHINEMFASAFAEWLDGQSGLRAAYAREGDLVKAHSGRVVIAPPERHMLVRGGRLRLTDDPPRHSCRPSVDVLFESVAREYGSTAAAVLLTGMGRDGAGGLLEIRNAGGLTIAQDEATSVVYGMPREAALIGAAERILPLGEIGPTVGALSAMREVAVA
jgi:two-component system chemotaxis response regulator CheB